ncbi:MAG: hypothetical protein NTX16_02210 [Actinobacteria bacterium]|nr:hypothetical protein [Actinomycetota bacterium]
MPAVIVLRVRSRSSSGRILWASAVVAPGDASAVAGLAEHDDLLAVGADQAALLVDHEDVAHARLPKEIAVQRAAGAVFGDVLHHRLKRRVHRAADVDHEAVDIVAPQVLPGHELADATHLLTPSVRWIPMVCGPPLALRDAAHLTAWPRAAGCVCRRRPRYH